MTPSDNAAVKSAGRALDLVEMLAGASTPQSFHDIGEALDIPASSLSHLLSTLADRGYVEHVDRRGGYRAGPALQALADRLARRRTPIEVVRPVLAELCETLGESASLNVLRGDDAEVAAAVHAEGLLIYRIPVGARTPLYAIASGKAILAAMSDEDVEAYIARTELRPLTPATVRTAAQLRREIRQVRAEGFAYSRGQILPGVVGIAHVLRLNGRPVGALVVGLPEVRLDEAKDALIREGLRLACRRAEELLTRAGAIDGSDLLPGPASQAP